MKRLQTAPTNAAFAFERGEAVFKLKNQAVDIPFVDNSIQNKLSLKNELGGVLASTIMVLSATVRDSIGSAVRRVKVGI
jgi:hypothetical protein